MQNDLNNNTAFFNIINNPELAYMGNDIEHINYIDNKRCISSNKGSLRPTTSIASSV